MYLVHHSVSAVLHHAHSSVRNGGIIFQLLDKTEL